MGRTGNGTSYLVSCFQQVPFSLCLTCFRAEGEVLVDFGVSWEALDCSEDSVRDSLVREVLHRLQIGLKIKMRRTRVNKIAKK